MKPGVQHKSPNAPKRGRGRPQVLVMPEPIPDTPENILRACLRTPPKKDWDFLKPGSDAYADGKPADQAVAPSGLIPASIEWLRGVARRVTVNRVVRREGELLMLRKLLEIYIREVRASTEAKTTQDTRIAHARKFVEWVEGKFTPGQGVHPAKHEDG